MPCVVNITDKTLCIYLIWLVPYLLMSSATENDFFFPCTSVFIDSLCLNLKGALFVVI